MIQKEHPFQILISQFNNCDDYRLLSRTEHTLSEILFLTFCALVSGSETYEEVGDFGEMKLKWLRKFLPYKNGIPSHDTIGRVLSFLNVKHLEKALANFSSYGIELPNGSIVNIDGKWISRSATSKEQQTKKSQGGKRAVIMVNAFCSALNSCLSSIRVGSKSGEKKALEDILVLLDLSHCIITLDAGFCHKDVVQQIIDVEADYVIGLKKNQPTLFAAAKDLIHRCPATEVHTDPQTDSHGRLEQRTCKVLNFSNLDQEYLDQYGSLLSKWPGLNCFIMVQCQRTVKSKNKTSNEARFYISSQQMMPEKANTVVRQHWHVENSLHWVLDATMKEDKGTKRAGNAAANFSILRKMAFNKLKAFDDPKVSMRRRLKKCAMDENYLEKVMQLQTSENQ